MIIEGKYADAKIFAKDLEDGARDQIVELLNQDFSKGSKIRIMPDVHQGMGCVIGFAGEMGDKVVPNIVGVDIGCGMLTVELGNVNIDLEKLDKIIRENIPYGTKVHGNRKFEFDRLKDLYIYRQLKDTRRLEKSIGSLGGGNHFIEVGVDSKDNKYLVLHSGSRNLGKQVAEIYQRLAVDLCSGKEDYFKRKEELIESYKEKGKKSKLKTELNNLKKEYKDSEPNYPKHLCYLSGEFRDRYLHDMKISQEYASVNRKSMAGIILSKLFGKNLNDFNYFETVHNYINFDDNIIRKGSISAYKDEKVLIPINMRDGSILAVGKGNPDWNYSAPHGAGRLLSRTQAKEDLSLDKFIDSMDGIYSTSVHKGTLDESPFAYKPIEDILDFIGETVDVLDIIRPIYNFKA